MGFGLDTMGTYFVYSQLIGKEQGFLWGYSPLNIDVDNLILKLQINLDQHRDCCVVLTIFYTYR